MPNVQFMPTGDLKNEYDTWNDDLTDNWQEVNNYYEESGISGYFQPGESRVGGEISLDNNDRERIEDGDIDLLNAKVDYEIENDGEVDSVIVFDPYIFDDSNRGGMAQIGKEGSNEGLDMRVGIVGDEGDTPELAFHELLHTLDARHYNASYAGTGVTTVMGPKSEEGGCSGGDFRWASDRNSEVATPSDCSTYQSTEERVSNFVDKWL